MHGRKTPDVVLSSDEFGVTYYPDKNAVGLQFVINTGEQVFISLPGELLQTLGTKIEDFFAKNPEASALRPIGPATAKPPPHH